MEYRAIYDDEYISHYGVKGMRWGRRKDGGPQGYKGTYPVASNGGAKTLTKLENENTKKMFDRFLDGLREEQNKQKEEWAAKKEQNEKDVIKALNGIDTRMSIARQMTSITTGFNLLGALNGIISFIGTIVKPIAEKVMEGAGVSASGRLIEVKQRGKSKS